MPQRSVLEDEIAAGADRSEECCDKQTEVEHRRASRGSPILCYLRTELHLSGFAVPRHVQLIGEAPGQARRPSLTAVSVFDLGGHRGEPCSVTEPMQGDDVEAPVEDADGPLPTERTLDIAKGVYRGLAFAYDKASSTATASPGTSGSAPTARRRSGTSASPSRSTVRASSGTGHGSNAEQCSDGSATDPVRPARLPHRQGGRPCKSETPDRTGPPPRRSSTGYANA